MGVLTHLGRPARDILYKDVSYNNAQYVVAYIESKGCDYAFIVDKEDYEKVLPYSWHVTSNNYISTSCIQDNKRKALYLHNLIMGRDAFKGKGQTESIDHINGNGFDNRKENLRLVSQSEQNINQIKKKRSIVLPPASGIQVEDIPRHIWYVRANGLHGDRFAIEFKTEGIVWKTTSSKKVTIGDKLIEAKQKLQELYAIYPHLDPATNIGNTAVLLESYNAIVGLANSV